MKPKQLLLSLLALFASITANAYDACIDGIYYNFSGNEATVTYRDTNYNSYAGIVVIPESVTYNGLAYSVTSIGSSAFRNCSALSTINIPNSVTSIGATAFFGCIGLTSISILNGMTNIGSSAFKGCNNLTSVNISISNIDQEAFQNCSSLTTVTISSSGTAKIGQSAFEGCANLSSLTLGNGISLIYPFAFHGCSSLTSISFPNSVSNIDSSAFSGCTSLTSVTFGTDIQQIGYNVFNECPNLTSVTMHRTTPCYVYGNSFSNRANATLYVPLGSKAAYEAAWGFNLYAWSEFMQIVEMPNPVIIGNTGFATYCCPYAVDLSGNTEFKAYIASGYNPATAKLVLTRVTEVPAGEGLYIIGTPGTYEVSPTTTSMFYSNLLIGVTEATTISPTEGDSGEKTNFILANGKHGVAFYSLSNSGELAAYKAYLQLPTGIIPDPGVKVLKIIFEDDDDDPTGIAITSSISQEDETIYNLAGQRVSTAQKGINIINGKKVIIK